MTKVRTALAGAALATVAIALAGCGHSTGAGGTGPKMLPWGLVSASGREVNVQYRMGGCLHDPKVAARESSTRVVITVRADGRRPGQVCPANEFFRTAQVELSTPVGRRTLLDGATGNPPPAARAFPSPGPRS